MTLDRTQLPVDLVVHRVWMSDDLGGGRPGRSIVYVTERRRRALGGVMIALGALLMIGAAIAHAVVALMLVGLAISVIGGVYGAGGRSGFYQITAEGRLGEFLGRTRPDLRSMRRMNV
jgi:hypothetical protein